MKYIINEPGEANEAMPIYSITRYGAEALFGIKYGPDIVGFNLNGFSYAFVGSPTEWEKQAVAERILRDARAIADEIDRQLNQVPANIREEVASMVWKFADAGLVLAKVKEKSKWESEQQKSSSNSPVTTAS